MKSVPFVFIIFIAALSLMIVVVGSPTKASADVSSSQLMLNCNDGPTIESPTVVSGSSESRTTTEYLDCSLITSSGAVYSSARVIEKVHTLRNSPTPNPSPTSTIAPIMGTMTYDDYYSVCKVGSSIRSSKVYSEVRDFVSRMVYSTVYCTGDCRSSTFRTQYCHGQTTLVTSSPLQ